MMHRRTKDGRCEQVRLTHTDGKGWGEIVPASYVPTEPYVVAFPPEQVRVTDLHDPRPDCLEICAATSPLSR